MQIFFEDKDLEELIISGKNHKYKKFQRDKRFMSSLVRVYKTMLATECASKLSQWSFLHYEKLKNYELSSIRVMNGRVERILFKETENGIVITIIELNETHYGNK